MRFAHTNIVSTNWRKLSDFYIKTFNCKLVPPVRKQSGEWLDKGTGMKNAKLQGAHLLLPGYSESGPTLEIYQYQHINENNETTPNTRGFGHIAFEVNNVEKVLDHLMENGGTTSGEISTKSIEGLGELTFIYAKDPEGNSIELQSWKRV